MRDRHRARISPDLCFPLRAGEERERAHRVDREKGGKSEGWREKEQRKNVSAKQHEFMDEQFYLRCSCSFAAAQRCVYWPASPPSFPASAPPRPCKGRSRLQRLHLQQRARHELSPHPKYRATTVRPPFFLSPHFLVQTRRNVSRFDDFACPHAILLLR